MDLIRRIVFVCTGNTCRSPMAEAIARREAEKRRLHVELASAGTDARAGDRATPEAVTACQEIDIDLSHHTAQSVAELLDDEETLYVVMARQHASWMQFVLSIPGERVIILGDGVPDPYGGSLAVYRSTRKRIVEEVGKLFDRIEPDLPSYSDGSSQQTDNELVYDIVPVTGEYVKTVSLMERRAFSDAWSLALLSDEIDNADAVFLAAVGKGARSAEVYAYGLALIAADVAQLPKLCVGERYRRRGLAEAILHAIEQRVIERGCVELTLEARVSNSPAISLYEKLGFESQGVRPNFYSDPKEDALIMTKTLEVPAAPAAQPETTADEQPELVFEFDESPTQAAAPAPAPAPAVDEEEDDLGYIPVAIPFDDEE